MNKELQEAIVMLIMSYILKFTIAYGVTYLVCWSFGIPFDHRYVWGVFALKLYLMGGEGLELKVEKAEKEKGVK